MSGQVLVTIQVLIPTLTLPMFKYENKDDAFLHLIMFHMHVRRLKVKFPEDFLMEIFMATLEDKERTWYKWLIQLVYVL